MSGTFIFSFLPTLAHTVGRFAVINKRRVARLVVVVCRVGNGNTNVCLTLGWRFKAQVIASFAALEKLCGDHGLIDGDQFVKRHHEQNWLSPPFNLGVIPLQCSQSVDGMNSRPGVSSVREMQKSERHVLVERSRLDRWGAWWDII